MRSTFDDWLDHIDSRLPESPDVAALRAALTSESSADPGFIRLTALMRRLLDAHVRLDGAGSSCATSGLDSAEQRLTQTINTGLANAVRQLESFIGIHHYLSDGQTLPAFHGWCISPDIGMWLVERIRVQPYDLIIEFGSGTSTLLLTKSMDVRLRHHGRPTRWRTRPLERRIVSFEHDAAYLASTQRMLTGHAVRQQVDLVHAPLIEWLDDQQSCRFYDCQPQLQRLSRALRPAGARILVLVDGPPGHIGRHARYPAVPHVFEALGSHHIDIVLDDANRPDEREVIDRWRSYWKERSIPFQEHTKPTEKGMFSASTTPSIRGPQT